MQFLCLVSGGLFCLVATDHMFFMSFFVCTFYCINFFNTSNTNTNILLVGGASKVIFYHAWTVQNDQNLFFGFTRRLHFSQYIVFFFDVFIYFIQH